ncbi:MAG: DUF2513 domain-containing protein [Acidobacteria bacterium]|nr:DUF2513 domain-containing protein [Acidobacteriota bacterium]
MRKILLAIEAHPHGHAPNRIDIDGYDQEAIQYHIFIMGEGDLLRVSKTTTMQSSSPSAIAHGLTWKGHEFVEAARQDTIWNRAKSLVGKAGAATLPVWMEALTKAAIEAMKGP